MPLVFIVAGVLVIFLSLKIESSFRWIGIGIGVISILTGLSFIFLKPKQKVQNHKHPKKSEEVGGNVRKTCTHTTSNVSSSSVGANSPQGLDKEVGSEETLSSNKNSTYVDNPTGTKKEIQKIERRNLKWNVIL